MPYTGGWSMHAPSRRSTGVLHRGPLALAVGGGSISIHGRSVELSATEFRAIRYLMINNGWLISWSELSTHLWENDAEEARVATRVAITRLQAKLGGRFLQRVPELGVRLECR